jgi:hypothetical protein
MFAQHNDGTHRHILRLVFHDTELAYGLDDGVTLLDVALVLDRIADRNNSQPTAIHLTMREPAAAPGMRTAS